MYKLDSLNTLALNSSASDFIELNDLSKLLTLNELINKNNNKFFILGGGSNVILPQTYNGLIIHNKLRGIEYNKLSQLNLQNPSLAYITAYAGENWDDFVLYTLNNNLFGLENLSLIPGTVGAAPVQNIGAYGVEVGQFIAYVITYDLMLHKFTVLANHECDFTYRNSLFKQNPNRYLIIAVIFKLLKNSNIQINYKDLQQELTTHNTATSVDVRNAVITIRKRKLPDPLMIPNVGSFFQNPIINKQQLEHIYSLAKQNLEMPVYNIDDNHVKLSAAWLIDKLGLKSYTMDSLGIYKNQALVIVNDIFAYRKKHCITISDFNNIDIASGMNNYVVTQDMVLNFANSIINKVYDAYGIRLLIEPVIIDSNISK